MSGPAVVLVRTRYDDPTSDARIEFPSEQDAEAYLRGIGFQMDGPRDAGMSNWICPALDGEGHPILDRQGRAVNLRGHLIRPGW